MPSVKEHIKSSCQEPPVKDWWHEDATLRVVLEHVQNSTRGILTFKRTGSSYKEMHKWMDEEYQNSTEHKRHDIINIPQTIKVVREKFGEEAVEEFLHHIKDDFNTPLLQRIMGKLRQFIVKDTSLSLSSQGQTGEILKSLTISKTGILCQKYLL